MKIYLEHANITVDDIDEAIRFLTIAFPDFTLRGSGEMTADGITRNWVHLGTEETYVALEQVSAADQGSRRPYRDIGINHIGFVVEDVDSIKNRLTENGYRKSIEVEPHPYRKRVYFYDGSGIEYEFVEYLSDNPAERNDYSI